MKTIDVLRGMRSKIEQGWTQHTSARDADGHSVNPRDDSAICWCLIGAACAVASTFEERCLVYSNLRWVAKIGDVAIFNDADGRTKEQVLAVVNAAIVSCEPQ